MMARNEIIESAPLYLFLGAGASRPFGKPTMEEFVKQLQVTAKGDPSEHVLQLLIGQRGEDLELILDDIDSIIEMDYVDPFRVTISHSKGTPYTPIPLNTQYVGEAIQNTWDITQQTAKALRTMIEEEVVREYRSIPTDDLSIVYGQFFDVIFDRIDATKECVPIFTTNYDLVIEEFCSRNQDRYRLVQGFSLDAIRRQYFWNVDEFDDFQIEQGKRNIVLFKLHGSVDWLLEVQRNRVVQAQAIRIDPRDGMYQNRLIYPATRKIAIDDPYFTAYDYFSRCSASALLNITIGYSFRDYDALSRLKANFRDSKRQSLVILSPEASDIIERIPFEVPNHVLLDGKFGRDPDGTEYLNSVRHVLDAVVVKRSPPHIGIISDLEET